MRLLTRISAYYVLVSLAVFMLAGFFFYYTFRDEVYEELDEQMRDEKRNIERMLDEADDIPSFYPGVNTEVHIQSAPQEMYMKLQRKDTLIHHPYEGEIPFRQWRFTADTDTGNYLVVLRRSLIDLEDLSEQIAYALFYSFLVLLACTVSINYLVLRRTFRPFYSTLNQLKKYSLDNASQLQPQRTSTKEFIELNKALQTMTERIQQDYRNVKEFTENASHEIQTPLAIIKNKLELLMQSEQMNSEQADLIHTAYQAANRLSKLNSSLILLTRIENREFATGDPVNIGDITSVLLKQMHEQFLLKGLHIELKKEGEFVHLLNRTLAEILLSNLLTNAVRYTAAGGTISILIEENSFTISNPGQPPAVPAEKLFVRFYKGEASSGSMGIGLSLVKKIADVHGLTVSYTYTQPLHLIKFSR
jgi:signal transduction histidine kinase